MMGNKWIIPAVVVSIIAVIATVLILNNNPQELTSEDGFIKVRLYDANGNPINPIETLSTVGLGPTGGARGVAFIDLTVRASNSGAIPLSCNILSTTVNGAVDSNFDTAMARSQKFLPTASSVEWTSNLFAVSSYEATPTPDTFAVSVRCQYTDVSGQQNIDQTGSIPLYVTSDGTGSFNVQINSPQGIPTLYCGDSICSASIGETATSCPGDCATVSVVSYRTTDLSYVLGSAIGYTATCGNTLTKYGYSSATCTSAIDVSCPLPANVGASFQLLNTKVIPDSINTWSTISPCLYQTASGLGVAFKVASTSGEPTSCPVGRWIRIDYTTSSPYASAVSNNAESFNLQKEVSCI